MRAEQSLPTPLKINMEPENHWVVEENRLPQVHFQVPCGSLPGCRFVGECHNIVNSPSCPANLNDASGLLLQVFRDRPSE